MERATPSSPIWPCYGWGLPRDLCYQRPGALLPHHFTLACAANGHRRCLFCCTFRRLTTPGRYPAPCPAELGLSSDGRIRRRSSLATLTKKMTPHTTDLLPCPTGSGVGAVENVSPGAQPPGILALGPATDLMAALVHADRRVRRRDLVAPHRRTGYCRSDLTPARPTPCNVLTGPHARPRPFEVFSYF